MSWKRLWLKRLTTSPTQNTGIEMPISPRTIRPASTGVPRKTAARRPMPMLNTTQITAAPSTSESVTGAAWVTCGITFAPRLTNDVRSRVMKSFFIISAYCTGIGLVEPEVVPHLAGASPGRRSARRSGRPDRRPASRRRSGTRAR